MLIGRLILVPELVWLVSEFLSEFQSGLLNLGADVWCTFCGMASIFLLMKSSTNSGL